MDDRSNAPIPPLRRNPPSFRVLMDMTLSMIGQHNHGNAPPLPLTETDIIHVDKFKLAQIVRNLVSNALKFSPRGSVATLHAVFIPSPEKVVVVNERRLSLSARQLVSRISARLRSSRSVSVSVAHLTDSVIAAPPIGQCTAGFLRIAVIDHG